jgi:hypothetical protein
MAMLVQISLKDLIVDAYAQAILAVANRPVAGQNAKEAAYRAAAHAVAKATGKTITPELVARAVSNR